MNAAVCLAGYGLAVILIAPRWLDAAGTERAPRLGILAWLLAIATAVGSLLAAASAVRSPNTVVAAAVATALADDAAARRFGRRTVAAAIAAMGGQPAPVGALGATGPSALARGLRLCASEPTWQTRIGRLGLALTVVALATGPYLFSVLPFCPHPWH